MSRLRLPLAKKKGGSGSVILLLILGSGPGTPIQFRQLSLSEVLPDLHGIGAVSDAVEAPLSNGSGEDG